MNTPADPEADHECVLPPPAIPADLLGRYSIDRDLDSEQDIARYVEIEAADERVSHVEKVKEEIVLGDKYTAWDVTTDKDRYWIIDNLTNLYSQKHFPSLDYTLTFHIGLMMRMSSRPSTADADDPTPFDEVFRRREQARELLERAIEVHDFQAVGMQLRECLISLVSAVRRRVILADAANRPQEANVKEWNDLLLDKLCGGGSNERLRKYLKGSANLVWDVANWLTHSQSATRTSASIAMHACDTVIGHYAQLVTKERTTEVSVCPICKSRNVRSHYDHKSEPDGDYYLTCGECNWSTHPSHAYT